jgi:DNA-binding PadR family transcriptional regulator
MRATQRLPTYNGRRTIWRVSAPLQEPTFLILAALAGEPAHGYGITQAVATLSGGRVKLRPGTLYGALDRLVEQGLVVADREEVVDGRLRRYYRLTDGGADLLEAEAQRLAGNANAAMAGLRRHRRSGTPGTAHA